MTSFQLCGEAFDNNGFIVIIRMTMKTLFTKGLTIKLNLLTGLNIGLCNGLYIM